MTAQKTFVNKALDHTDIWTTYIDFELVFKPGQVKVEVTLLHDVRVPAGKLGNDSGRHVLHKLIRPVQQVEEWLPYSVGKFGFTEYFYSGLVLL